MKKTVITLLIAFATITSLSATGWCVATPSGENPGYCSEGVDGTGKCVKIRIQGANRCSDDQPEDPGQIL